MGLGDGEGTMLGLSEGLGDGDWEASGEREASGETELEGAGDMLGSGKEEQGTLWSGTNGQGPSGPH